MVEKRPGLTVPFSHVSPSVPVLLVKELRVWSEEMRLCACAWGFFLSGGGLLRVQRRFEAGFKSDGHC